MSTPREQFDAALSTYLRDAHRAGFDRGIAVAERIVGWLSTPTQSGHVKDVRKWARAAIAEAERREENGG